MGCSVVCGGVMGVVGMWCAVSWSWGCYFGLFRGTDYCRWVWGLFRVVGYGSFGWRETVVCRKDDRLVCLSPRVGELVWGSAGSWLECGRRLPSVCLVSIARCSVSDPSFVVDFGMSWCALA